MDIAAHSELLHSRYGACVPLVGPARASPRGGTNEQRGDIAYLSSVETPSEVCLGLACVARRRGARDTLLVFVPFDEPRNEIFVELPLVAFRDAEDPARRRGLQLLPLNEYSFLCCRVKDGLPPRKGLFVTFRSSAAQKRFQNAFRQAVCDGAMDDSRQGCGIPQNITVGNEAVNENYTEVVATRGGTKLMSPSNGERVYETASFIDGLLAERDRRREAYLTDTRSQPPTDGRQSGDTGFSAWARQHQASYPKTWNMLAGAAERQVEMERRAQHRDGSRAGWPSSTSGVSREQLHPPTLEGRVARLDEMRAAMEVFDSMNEAQGCGEMSLMGAAREFLRQHQDNLCRLEQGGGAMWPSQPPANDNRDDVPLPSGDATQQHSVKLPLEGAQESGVAASLAQQVRYDGLRLQQPQLEKPREDYYHYQQQRQNPAPEMTAMPQPNAGAAAPSRGSESLGSGKGAVDPLFLPHGSQRKIQEDLRRARETESRILTALQKAPSKSTSAKSMFGSTPGTPLLRPSPSDVGAGTGIGTEGGGGDIAMPSLEATDTTVPLVAPPIHIEDVVSEPAKESPKTTKEETPRCGSGWNAVRDPSSGKYYYVHTATKRTTWKVEETFEGEEHHHHKPQQEKEKEQGKAVNEAPKCGPGWRAVTDPRTGRTYYVNKSTNATTWKLGETLGVEGGGTSVADTESSQKQNVTKKAEWAERKDPATGKVYYYNKKTKQTTWKRSETDLEPA